MTGTLAVILLHWQVAPPFVSWPYPLFFLSSSSCPRIETRPVRIAYSNDASFRSSFSRQNSFNAVNELKFF
ncbi:hypothetical protein A4A49_02247 [Nicotiana attenuata]|uniref:Secreted protein n=1 Tax=Nicotiana attenuata TaxID=49451 RepID=A0A1J6IW33_NICAT|nr:hypothetical protein A4A49_02247 [Nicotiana attenuata]